MPLQPNEPSYYTPSSTYYSINYIVQAVVGGVDVNEEKVANMNKENLKAFLLGRIPSTADDPKDLKELTDLIPKLKADPAKREERRDLSRRARENLAELGARLKFAWKNFNVSKRYLNVLLMRDDTNADLQESTRRYNTIVLGTPEERGELLEERINSVADLFFRVVNEGISDKEVIDDLEKYHNMQDLVANSEEYLKDKNFEISPEARALLVKMHRHMGEINVPWQRVRIIANPNYEHLEIPELITADKQTMRRLNSYLDGTVNANGKRTAISMAQEELPLIVNGCRTTAGINRQALITERIEEDFQPNKEGSIITFISKDTGKLMTEEYGCSIASTTIGQFFEKGYILVTAPDGDAACYYVAPNGKIVRSTADEMLQDFLPEMESVLHGVHEANKGFFIGSKEYSDAMKGLERLTASLQGFGRNIDPSKLAGMKKQFEDVKNLCERYKATKDPDNFKNERERIRYEAMERAYDCCLNKMALIDLQHQAKAVEVFAGLAGHRGTARTEAFPVSDARTAHTETSYRYAKVYRKGDQVIDNSIRESDVGDVADKLRQEIFDGLEATVSMRRFNLEKARVVHAKMVLLELIMMNRTLDKDKIIASPLERAYAQKGDIVVEALTKNPYFKAVTQKMDAEMSRHFAVNNGAKVLAKKLSKIAEQVFPAPDKEPEPEAEKDKKAEKKEEELPPKELKNENAVLTN